jgi:hypothetical protein
MTEGDHLEDAGIECSILLKLIFKKCDWGGGGAWARSIWLRIGIGDLLL